MVEVSNKNNAGVTSWCFILSLLFCLLYVSGCLRSLLEEKQNGLKSVLPCAILRAFHLECNQSGQVSILPCATLHGVSEFIKNMILIKVLCFKITVHRFWHLLSRDSGRLFLLGEKLNTLESVLDCAMESLPVVPLYLQASCSPIMRR